MPRFIWRDGAWRHPSSGELMPVPHREGVCIPTIRSDIEDYQSPITGERVASRSGQRYDLERHDCVLAPPFKKFDPEEYRDRKSRQAKELAARRGRAGS